MRSSLRSAVLLFALVSLSCGGQEEGEPASDPGQRNGLLPIFQAEWSYEGDTGPEAWVSLDPAYRMCGGSAQSPIDLPEIDPGMFSTLAFNYQAAAARVSERAPFIELQVEYGGEVELLSQRYYLDRIQLHLPGEHTIGGREQAGEVHLVHESLEGRKLIVGVHLRAGASPNPFFTSLAGFLAADTDAQMVGVQPRDVLPVNRAFFMYTGSLTSPPCSEGVQWIMMRYPIVIADHELAMLKSRHSANNRPVQPINSRSILMASPRRIESRPTEQVVIVTPRGERGVEEAEPAPMPKPVAVELEAAQTPESQPKRRVYRSTDARPEDGQRFQPTYLHCLEAASLSYLPPFSGASSGGWDESLTNDPYFSDVHRYAIEGENMAGAFHFTRIDESGQQTIMAIPVRLGKPNPSWVDSTGLGDAVPWQELVPPTWSESLYEAPINSANCGPDLQWMVLGHPIELSEKQLTDWQRRRR